MNSVIFGCEKYRNPRIMDGYYDKYYISTPGSQDFSIYQKYYYNKEDDIKFIGSSLFKQVGDDVQVLVYYFDDVKSWFEVDDMLKEYDFDNSIISYNDYYYIEKKGHSTYKVYLYDIDKHILYYLHEKN